MPHHTDLPRYTRSSPPRADTGVRRAGSVRRRAIAGTVAVVAVLLVTGCSSPPPTIDQGLTAAPTTLAPTDGLPGVATGTETQTAEIVRRAAEAHFTNHALQSLLVQVRVDGRIIETVVLGDSMSGVPLTRADRFRNGAVAITYVSATMLRLAEDGLIDIDAPIADYVPDLPFAQTTTARMLADMTAGYPDHVANSDFLAAFTADPFRQFDRDEILGYSAQAPRTFEPGTNWDYSHSGYFALGKVLEAAGGAPLETLIAKYVLDPLGLSGTSSSATAQIPEPAVHAFTLDRGIWEDSTNWNPSWTLPPGSVETTTIDDMASSFDDIIGRGTLLEPDSTTELLTPLPAGFGAPVDGCRSCHELTPAFNYGLGIVLKNEWAYQTPLFGGFFSSVATLPEARNAGHSVTIAVAATATQATYSDWSATLPNWSTQLVDGLAATLVPSNPPPPWALPTL